VISKVKEVEDHWKGRRI